MARPRLPIALTIAGSDSGGGAGIQADLKTFAAFGVHGTSAITCLTAQNPAGVTGIQAATPRLVVQQIEAVFAELPPQAVKTGMLYSTGIIRAVVQALKARQPAHLVVDPVMIATSGARLLKADAVRALCTQLLPVASLVTPNLDEAAILVGRPLGSVTDLQEAAQEIHARFGCAALVKGGHLPGQRVAVDVFFDGKEGLLLEAPYVRGVATHGTGCTYSAAITASLARGDSLSEAVRRAKLFITAAIHDSQRIGRHTVLDTLGLQA